MPAMPQQPTLTLAQLARLRPCESRLKAMRAAFPARRRITAAAAREAGATFTDLLWAASAVAREDADVERRLRLWLADCAARVLHIYERGNRGDAPRGAIIAARAFARGEISADAMAAASDAARAAEMAARAAASAAASAQSAARAAARAWQFDRLIARLSNPEPEDWPLPLRAAAGAA